MPPVLMRDGKGQMTDGATAYRIPGYPHLRVEPMYDDPPNLYDGRYARAHLYAWLVRDTRFISGLDRWRRWMVIMRPTLAEVRYWVVDGGPAMWDPELRKRELRWQPMTERLERGDTYEMSNGVHWIIVNPEWPRGEDPFIERCSGCDRCEPSRTA